MLNGLKGAIFDMDGTLLDSMPAWDNIGEKYLRSIGYEPKEGLGRMLMKMSLHQGACYCKREYGIPAPVEALERGVNGMVEDFYRHEVVPKKGAAALLEALSANGVRMCIATATDRYLVDEALARCNIAKYFDGIFTCGQVGHGKDEPHIYREALKCLGTDRTDTIVFEDALHALKTAKNDGFATAAVFDAHEEAQEELRSLADVYLTELTETDKLLEAVKRLFGRLSQA